MNTFLLIWLPLCCCMLFRGRALEEQMWAETFIRKRGADEKREERRERSSWILAEPELLRSPTYCHHDSSSSTIRSNHSLVFINVSLNTVTLFFKIQNWTSSSPTQPHASLPSLQYRLLHRPSHASSQSTLLIPSSIISSGPCQTGTRYSTWWKRTVCQKPCANSLTRSAEKEGDCEAGNWWHRF